MKSKDKALDKIKKYILWVNNKFGKKSKIFKVDNGTEYINKDTEKFLAEQGIELETIIPYSPLQNGAAEQLNDMIVKLACAMLIGQKLSTFLWEEAVVHAVYLQN